MQEYRLAICEDDAVLRKGICGLCGQILDELGIAHQIQSFPDGESLEEYLDQKGQVFDLLILDIQMREKSGMELAKELRCKKDRVSIIFLSGNEQYLRDGYQVQPIHFLLKPLEREELRAALLTDWEQNHRSRTVVLEKGARRIIVNLEQLVFAETNGNHGVRLYLDGRDLKDFPIGISELERKLPADSFIRCHNSYLVNLAHVREMKNAAFLMDDGISLPIGRKYSQQCRDSFIIHINR